MRAADTLKRKRTEAVTMHDIATLTIRPSRGARTAAARDHQPAVEAESHAPVLISAVLASVRYLLATSRSHRRPADRDYPKRYAFLEYASMAREMDRL